MNMIRTNSPPDIRKMLLHLGYNEIAAQAILNELDTLFEEINFDRLKQKAALAIQAKDTNGLIGSLKEMMVSLENKGYYRPDYPTKLIRLLVNGLCLRNDDIFLVIDHAGISQEEKRKEKEFLASCAAITQLGYILLRGLISDIKAAHSGPHVFIAIDSFNPGSMIFVDFSIDSIREINVEQAYHQKENYYYLKNPASGSDEETCSLLKEYYSSFHVTADTGLSHDIHNNLGIAYDKAGRYEKAIEELMEALRLDPDYVEVHNNLAVTYDKMGLFEEALTELEEALRLRPEYAEAHCNLGSIYARSGRYEEGIKELEEALRINPCYAGARNNLGNIYAEQNKTQEAIREFQEALRLNPDYPLARSNLGNIYAGLGRHEDALREFQEALRLDPESPEAYHGMGLALYNLGNYERAAQALIRAGCLAPELLDSVPDKLLLKVRQGVSRLKGRE